MSQYETVITIYDRLVEVYDKLPPETQQGFADCLYLLSEQLKRQSWINLHIDNKHLSQALYLANLRIDDLIEDAKVIKGRNRELQSKINQLEFKLKHLNKHSCHK